MTMRRKEGRKVGRPFCLFSFIFAVCFFLLLFPTLAVDVNGSSGGSTNTTGMNLSDGYQCIPSCNNFLTNPYCNSTSCSAVSVPFSSFYDESANGSYTSCTGCADGNETCLDSSCYSNACVHQVCRPSDPWDGDGFCDSHSGIQEPNDCCIDGDGICYTAVDHGCDAIDDDCRGGSTCGNGVCDFVSGDSCASCPFDCGVCPPPQPPEGPGGTGGAIGTPQHVKCDSNVDCARDNEICNLSYCPQGVCGWCTTCYTNYTKVCSGNRLVFHDVSGCGASDQLMGECQYGCDSKTNSCFTSHCGNAVCDAGENCSTCQGDCLECPLLTEETQTASGNYTQGECDSVSFHLVVINGVGFCVADESAQDPSVSVSESGEAPAGIQIVAGGSVYTYFTLGEDFNASGLNISFKVSRDWMVQHNATAETIVLSVYDPALRKWSEIPVTVKGSDADYYYFEAVIPRSAMGLKNFAVNMKAAPLAPVCGNKVCEPGEKCYTCPSDCGSCEAEKYVRENPWLWAILAVAIAVLLVIPVWWFLIAKKKGQIKPPIEPPTRL